MGYSAELLKDRVTIQNRKAPTVGPYGIDSEGVEFEAAACVWADVSWAKGKTAMTAGALDAYGVKIVRMRWNNIVTERSRIQFEGRTYQILPDTFNADRQGNTIQFLCQQIVNDK